MDIATLLMVSFVITGAIGLALFLIGYLVSMATAFGNNHLGWGIAILLFGPMAVPYCFTYHDLAAWPRGLLIKSLAALGLAFILALAFLFVRAPAPTPSSQQLSSPTNSVPPADSTKHPKSQFANVITRPKP